MKTDENGDSIWLRTYVNPHTDKNATVLYRTDSTLLLFGDHALGSTNDDVIRLIETDLEGNVIWGGQYGNEFRMVGRQDIAQLDNGDIVFTYLASEKGNFDTIFLKITRINNQGLEVWTKDVNNLEYLWNPGSVVALDNGGFLLSSHRSNVDPGWWFPPILIWLDSLGNVVKQYNFPGETESIIVDLIITSAGIIIGTGYIDKWDLGFAGWVFALSQEGELLWNREIVDLRFPLKVSVLNAVEEAENGGLILTGFIWDTVSNQIPDVSNVNIWLVKLDSLGCLEPGCSDLQIVVSERNLPDRNDQFLIYPNPAQNELYIDEIADAERKDLQLIIRNFCGETELIIDLNNHNSEVISVSTLPNGIHYIQIIDQFGIIIQVEKFIIIK